MNDRELRENAVEDLLDTIANHPQDALFVLESVAKGVESNLSIEEFTQKYAPLLPEYRKLLHKRITVEIRKETIRKFQIPV